MWGANIYDELWTLKFQKYALPLQDKEVTGCQEFMRNKHEHIQCLDIYLGSLAEGNMGIGRRKLDAVVLEAREAQEWTNGPLDVGEERKTFLFV